MSDTKTPVPDLAAIAAGLPGIAEAAGQVVMEVYASDFAVRRKADKSPVSDADERAEALILTALAELAPEIPVVAEERFAAGHVPDIAGRPFFLVDPLDGTKEFVHRRGDFTVNIGLVAAGEPLLGVVHVPVTRESYWVSGEGDARVAWRREGGEAAARIATRAVPPSGLVAIASRSHSNSRTQAFLNELGVAETITAGSSLKFCRLAEGRADVYPRFGPTSEWDTAAGHAVLTAAGGHVVTADGEPFRYGKADFINPGFIAWGRSGAQSNPQSNSRSNP